MAQGEAERAGIQGWVAVLLAFVGGFVDAVGYLVLLRMFTGHLTGNSSGLGIFLAEADWKQALHRGFMIPLFLVGVGVGTGLQELLSRRGVRATYALTFAVEGLLLVLFMALGQPLLGSSGLPPSPGWRFYILAMLPALALGFQNATLHRIELGEVRTTYVSAMLTKMVQEFVRWLFWLRDRALGRPRADEEFSGRHMLLMLVAWLAFVGGAVCGTVTRFRWGLYCLAIPLAGLMIAIVCDLISPLSLSESPALKQQKPGEAAARGQ